MEIISRSLYLFDSVDTESKIEEKIKCVYMQRIQDISNLKVAF